MPILLSILKALLEFEYWYSLQLYLTVFRYPKMTFQGWFFNLGKGKMLQGFKSEQAGDPKGCFWPLCECNIQWLFFFKVRLALNGDCDWSKVPNSLWTIYWLFEIHCIMSSIYWFQQFLLCGCFRKLLTSHCFLLIFFWSCRTFFGIIFHKFLLGLIFWSNFGEWWCQI